MKSARTSRPSLPFQRSLRRRTAPRQATTTAPAAQSPQPTKTKLRPPTPHQRMWKARHTVTQDRRYMTEEPRPRRLPRTTAAVRHTTAGVPRLTTAEVHPRTTAVDRRCSGGGRPNACGRSPPSLANSSPPADAPWTELAAGLSAFRHGRSTRFTAKSVLGPYPISKSCFRESSRSSPTNGGALSLSSTRGLATR